MPKIIAKMPKGGLFCVKNSINVTKIALQKAKYSKCATTTKKPENWIVLSEDRFDSLEGQYATKRKRSNLLIIQTVDPF